ncbi:MAG: HmuY family protein [Niabella sp.]
MKKFLLLSMTVAALVSCSKDKDPVIIVPPSNGSTMELNGTTTNAGANAENSVFVDFSADKQTSVLRNSWDLGFYSGSDYKVVINLTNGASAVAVNKTDINAVTASDFNKDTLKVGLNGFMPVGSFNVIDDTREANILTKTVIAPISATEGDNKVYILNREGGDGTVAENTGLFKIRILRKGTGYSLQYAKLTETTFKTLDINKNGDYNFQFASLTSGTVVNVEPEKSNWDITWSWSMHYTGNFPYVFSDLVFVNNIGGVSAFERVYASADVATAAYTNFNKDSVSKYSFLNDRRVIGSNWRATTGTIGVKKDRFYVVKDPDGNVYKLKFLSFAAQDGGTRGRPQIQYELIK